MTTRERSYRGLSARAAVGYLERLGGEQVEADAEDERRVEGEGWVARVSEADVTVGPSVTLSEVTVRFEGEAATLEPLIGKFSQKAIRAGG